MGVGAYRITEPAQMLTVDVDRLRSTFGDCGAAVFAFRPDQVELEVMLKNWLELREGHPQEDLMMTVQTVGIKDEDESRRYDFRPAGNPSDCTSCPRSVSTCPGARRTAQPCRPSS